MEEKEPRFPRLHDLKMIEPMIVREVDPCDSDKTEYHRFRDWKQAVRWIAKQGGPRFSVKEAMYGLVHDGMIELGDYEFVFDAGIPVIQDHSREK